MGEVATGTRGADSSSCAGLSTFASPTLSCEVEAVGGGPIGDDASEMTRLGSDCSRVSGDTGGEAGGMKDDRLLRPSEEGRRRPRPSYELKEGDVGMVVEGDGRTGEDVGETDKGCSPEAAVAGPGDTSASATGTVGFGVSEVSERSGPGDAVGDDGGEG